MITRAIKKDDNGYSEFIFGHGYTDYKKEMAYIKQDIETALYEWKYDCFFNLNAGIDWRARLGYHGQKQFLDEEIKEVISNRIGVLRIQNFESNVIDRVYTCTVQVLTIYSEEELSIEFAQGV